VVGTLQGEVANIAARIPAKVVSVAGEVGTRVAAGQVVAVLDDQDLQRQASQAREAAAAAAANLAKAKKGRDLKEKELQGRLGETRQGVQQAELNLDKARAGETAARKVGQGDVDRAKAALTRAQAALRQARAGARPEEIRKAQVGVDAAQRGVNTARTEMERIQRLVDQNALPRVRLTKAQSDYDAARAQLEQAEAGLALAKAGATPEQIAEAQAGVKEAQAGVEQAEAGMASRVEAATKDVRLAEAAVENARRGVQQAESMMADPLKLADEDINAAQAQLAQANLQAQQATDQIQHTRLTTPIGGVISAVNINVGEIASPGRPLMTVAGTSHLYLQASIPARLVNVFRPGRPVSIEVDTLPGRKIPGIVREVSSAANPDGRSYPARIDMTNPPEGLRAGATARATIVAGRAGRSPGAAPSE
jgi:multidrug resistance efflux pump